MSKNYTDDKIKLKEAGVLTQCHFDAFFFLGLTHTLETKGREGAEGVSNT